MSGGLHPTQAHPSVPAPGFFGRLAPGQYVALSVTDTGVGMDNGDDDTGIRAILSPRSRSGKVRDSASAKSTVSSNNLAGMRSSVRSAAKAPSSGPIETGEAEGAPVPEGMREETILVIEDEQDVRAYTSDSLRELGYRVIEAPDGPSALRVLEREDRVDLMFTDVVLPGGMTGGQVAAQIRHGVPPSTSCSRQDMRGMRSWKTHGRQIELTAGA
jgi:CheY-like chemotaxis protein